MLIRIAICIAAILSLYRGTAIWGSYISMHHTTTAATTTATNSIVTKPLLLREVSTEDGGIRHQYSKKEGEGAREAEDSLPISLNNSASDDVTETEEDSRMHHTLLSVISESSFVRNRIIELVLLQYENNIPSSISFSTQMTSSRSPLPLSLPEKLCRALETIVNEGSIEENNNENVIIEIDTEGSNSANMHQILTSYLTKSTYAREKIIHLIIDKYSMSSSSSTASLPKLNTAFEVLHYMEIDSYPIPIKDYPYLYIGSVGVSLNHYAIQKEGISYIINWSSSFTCNNNNVFLPNIVYACISNIRGKDMIHHLDRLNKAVDLIFRTRKEDDASKIMIQCYHGKHVSVTIIVAYLMKYENMTANEATSLIKHTRPKAVPYYNVLEEYSKKYLSIN
jgi:hypothetical protein